MLSPLGGGRPDHVGDANGDLPRLTHVVCASRGRSQPRAQRAGRGEADVSPGPGNLHKSVSPLLGADLDRTGTIHYNTCGKVQL
jgi:hypothetical protein